jgi:hypothetical protein
MRCEMRGVLEGGVTLDQRVEDEISLTASGTQRGTISGFVGDDVMPSAPERAGRKEA